MCMCGGLNEIITSTVECLGSTKSLHMVAVSLSKIL